MSLVKSNSKFNSLDELENLGLLDNAIANATERRNVAQQNALPELLDKEASSVMGGQSVIKIFPPYTIGLIAQDPQNI
jgi:hypothetical protein